MKEQEEKKSEQNPPNPPSQGGKKKIAILHDAFLYRGWGERLVTLMAKSLGADLVSGFFSSGSFDPRELGFEGKMIALGEPVFTKGIRHLVLKWRFFWKAHILREYDTIIFSGDCLGALRHTEGRQNIYYCHTPPRYLYDFREKYLLSLPFFLRPIFALAFSFFASVYERNIRQFDLIITNSSTVQKRLRDFTHMDSSIIYPPTDTQFFTPMREAIYTDVPFPSKSYFYSWARLSPPKRVDTIVSAFLGMPERRLILSYGRNDPMKDRILRMIEGYENIIAIESPSDRLLLQLIQWAIATIYIPIDEDFGMSPVESMACGTPVIGADEGWLRETVIEGKTGKLIEIVNCELWSVNLKQIIQNTKKSEWVSMWDDCRERAEDFSLEKFEKKLQSLLVKS